MLRIIQVIGIAALYLPTLITHADNNPASPLHSGAAIQQQVQAYLERQFKGQNHFDRIEITVNNLDPRLRLKQCTQELHLNSTQHAQLNNRHTVKVACKSGQPWTIFVSARILAYAKILVAAEPLVRGQIIHKEQLASQVRRFKLNDRTFSDRKQLVGMQLKRSISQGEAIRSHFVTAAKVVKRGDEVVLAAMLGNTQITTEATALTDGKIGDQIRVKNNSSTRIVKARIIAPGRVEVIL